MKAPPSPACAKASAGRREDSINCVYSRNLATSPGFNFFGGSSLRRRSGGPRRSDIGEALSADKESGLSSLSLTTTSVLLIGGWAGLGGRESFLGHRPASPRGERDESGCCLRQCGGEACPPEFSLGGNFGGRSGGE